MLQFAKRFALWHSLDMGKIHVLSEQLRNQIAAGEVVERPSSIVKELVENALDAGATRIKIEIENGGGKRISVTDNGFGMSREDAELSVLRHATSKIATKDDLFAISSFGFRGEALASIASVSHFSLHTRERGAIGGTAVSISGGHEPSIADTGVSEGTNITVSDLFFNVPARIKFLKSEATESRHVAKMVEDLALANPEVGFEYHSNKREMLRVPAGQTERERVESIIGRELFAPLLPLSRSGGTVEITGFCSPAGHGISSRDRQWIFVNRRPVSDKTILSAVREAYSSLLPHGQQPQFLLFLTLPADLVDVNVHPRKSEVRFLHPQEVFLAVKQTLESALKSGKMNFSAPSNSFQSFKERGDIDLIDSVRYEVPKTSSMRFAESKTLYRPTSSQTRAALQFSEQILASSERNIERDSRISPSDWVGLDGESYRLIGQLRNSFLLVETSQGLMILDQHAVHERTRYDQFFSALQSKKPLIQPLLLPEVVDLSAREVQVLEEYRDLLTSLGFEWSEIGDRSFQLSAVPSGTASNDLPKLFRELLAELAAEGTTKALQSAEIRALTYLSCRGAVKFGDALSTQEQEGVLQKWLSDASGSACPHGRPVSWEIPFSEIEKHVSR